jgi:hypothetical protein
MAKTYRSSNSKGMRNPGSATNDIGNPATSGLVSLTLAA